MKKILVFALLSTTLSALTFFFWTGRSTGAAALASSKSLTDVERIDQLLGEMKTADLSKLPALEVRPFEIPGASVDVMRARLEETYEIEGIGRDTVQLSGWIAAKIDEAHPMEGETEVKWGTAISDTEFIGMELRGESPKFGPVIVTISKDVPSKGQVGALEFSLGEALALNRVYSKYRQANPYEIPPAAAVEPTPPPAPAAAPATADERAITRVMANLWRSLERRDPVSYMRDFAPDFDFEGSASPDKTVRNRQQYTADLREQLSNVQTLKVNENPPRIRVTGRLATVSASGTNTVVQKEGESGDTPWRATAQLRKVGNRWLLVQNQVRFRQVEATTATDKSLSQGELRKRASACRASLSIDVYMPKLDLHMKTGHPVIWYSEVQTIPPVGYTASVSLTPTPMLSGGRQVATLEHGSVKFREIVRHIALQGKKRPDQFAGR